MELLEDEEEQGAPLSSAQQADLLLPPLPSLSPAHFSGVPRENSASLEELPAAMDLCQDMADHQPVPELRPSRSSYRNSAGGGFRKSRSDSKENFGQRGSSPFQKPEKAGRSTSASMSSRPTTAGAESANGVTSTSWREEWTPDHDLKIQKPVGLLLQPLPAVNGKKPPPLPPLPARPPESGSVLCAPSLSSGFVPPPPLLVAGQAAASREVRSASPAGSTAGTEDAGSAPMVDDAALRRISLSANAKVATPPDFRRRRTPDASDAIAPIGRDDTQAALVAGEAVDGVEAAYLATESDAKGASEGLGESGQGGDFSELARAFTCMEGGFP